MLVLADLLTLIVTYVLTDLLRCAVWMDRPWPEKVPGYGSTLRDHIEMMALLVVLWPLILRWMGCYKLDRRPLRWLARQVVMASAVLALSMSAYSMLFARGIYPRAQIGLLMLLLPAATILLRKLALSRARSRAQG